MYETIRKKRIEAILPLNLQAHGQFFKVPPVIPRLFHCRVQAMRASNENTECPIVEFEVRCEGRGLYDVTDTVRAHLRASGRSTGLCTVFVRHTSASLIVQENADKTVQSDLNAFLTRLVPDGDKLFAHTDEGPDDMPSHVRAALTATSIGIPFADGELLLGRWQAIYLFEHRRAPHTRKVVLHFA